MCNTFALKLCRTIECVQNLSLRLALHGFKSDGSNGAWVGDNSKAVAPPTDAQTHFAVSENDYDVSRHQCLKFIRVFMTK